MANHKDILSWIEDQKKAMCDLAVRWSNINSHTANVKGVKECTRQMAEAFGVFKENVNEIELPNYTAIDARGESYPQPVAPAFSIRKRPEAQKQALLVCHADTVYHPDDPFQTASELDDGKINGPGITDAKGGIVVMLKSLEAFEQSPLADRIGWQVIINTDEEIGSPSSSGLLAEAAKEAKIGLVFEPALSDGSLVGTRKGSGNFTLVANGRAAHAGRDHAAGRNAIDAAARCIVRISALSGSKPGLTVNFGTIAGGRAANVVADCATARFNVRYVEDNDEKYMREEIDRVITDISGQTAVELKIHGAFTAPPKNLYGKTQALFGEVQNCAKEIDLKIELKESGGVCDGNRLQAAGLPTVDTLGVVGDMIHSHEEFVETGSFVDRAKLTALVLINWAEGKWDI